jgi:Ca2+-binding EF-hand superfamily protein
MTKEQVFSEFADNFPLSPYIKRDDFIRFYEGVSLTIPSDDLFMLRIKNSWGVMEDEENEVSDEVISSVVKSIRFKLIQKTNGNHEEFIMRKFFREFDRNGNGTICLDELNALLIKIEIPVQKKFLIPIFKKFDRNNNGMIEIEEFIDFIINNSYP